MEDKNNKNISEKEIQQGAIEEIVRGINWIVQEAVRNCVTNSYDGLIISKGNGDKWNVQYNGKTHEILPYGSITPNIGKMVKVIVPQGNQSLAYFI